MTGTKSDKTPVLKKKSFELCFLSATKMELTVGLSATELQ